MAHLVGRQAEGNVMRNEYGVLGGFEDTGREEVKKDFKRIAKPVDKPDFFMGGCGPTVPTGPKRKLRTSWMSQSDTSGSGAPPRVEHVPKPFKKWTPIAKKKPPPRSATHDGTVDPSSDHNNALPTRKGRKPQPGAGVKTEGGEDATKEEETTKSAAAADAAPLKRTQTAPTPRVGTSSRSPGPPKPIADSAPEQKEETPKEEVKEENTTTKKEEAPAAAAVPPKAAATKSKSPSPTRNANTTKTAATKADRSSSPLQRAKTTEPAWQPDTLMVKRPLYADDAEPVPKEEESTAASKTVEELQKEIEKLKQEKGELARQLKKTKGAAGMNKELKEEIAELKQKLSKAATDDGSARKFKKLENKLNTLKMIMDGKVDLNSIDSMQDHIQTLNMILNQDLKKGGMNSMKNIWA